MNFDYTSFFLLFSFCLTYRDLDLVSLLRSLDFDRDLERESRERDRERERERLLERDLDASRSRLLIQKKKMHFYDEIH